MLKHSKSFQTLLSVIVIFTVILSGFHPSPAQAQAGDGLKRQFNADSGKVSFIGPESGHVLLASKALGTFIRPENPALALAKRYAPEFGIQNPERDLSEIKAKHSDDGRVMVRYQQSYEGIPVMGAELIVNTNENGDLYSMNGEVSPNLSLPTQPEVASEQARDSALQAVAEYYQKTPADFVASEPALWIFDESLLRPSTLPVELVWRMEVTPRELGMPMRELVLVNAQKGGLSLHFNQIDTGWESAKTEPIQPNQDIGPTPIVTETPLPTETPVPTEASIPTETSLPLDTPASTDNTTDASSSDGVDTVLATTWYVATTGNNSNSCTTTGSPCLTINGAIGKAAASGDTIKVATGTYTGSGAEVVLINKSVTLSGGWNAAFTTQGGISTIDGQMARRGVTVNTGITATIERFVVQNGNTGSDHGGGIKNSGTLMLNNSTVSGNSANDGYGGGIFNGGTTILNNSTISGNSASAGGGIYNGGTLTLDNSTVSGNIVPNGPYGGHDGGGIYNNGSTVTLNNSTISANSAVHGGGIYPNIGTVTLKNTLLAGNSAMGDGQDCQYSIGSAGYNLIGNTSGCNFAATTGDLTNVNPNLGLLIGAPGYHPLLVGSPAINAGNPAGCTGSTGVLSTDQRGAPRVGICDIGAYEYTTPGSATSIVTASGTPQRTAPFTQFANPLKAAVLDSLGSPVSGVTVTFTAPGSGASGTFANTGTNITSVLTDARGIATTSAFTANGQLGAYLVAASASGVGSVNFTLENAFKYVSPSGNDANSCSAPASPCLTINGAIGKAMPGETIKVAGGTYTSVSGFVVNINKSVTLSGGWNASFSAQGGTSTIDGESARGGVKVDCFVASLNRFIITNGAQNGGVQNYCGDLTISNSTISNNTQISGFGGIYSSSGNVILNNVTVSGNIASYGGGIYINSGTLSLNNVTISNNTGGGIYIDPNGGASVSVKNSILAGNAGNDCTGTIVSSGYNLIGNISSYCTFNATTGDLVGTSTNPINPRLAPLQDNGGTTLTHALMAGSPAIDAGNPATCLPTDQRGVARPIGARCDIGAYEGSVPFVPAPLVNTYTAGGTSSLPGTFLCNQTQPNCTSNANAHADAAHTYAIGTYDFYATQFNRDSIDNNGMVITSTVQYCEPGFACPYENAFWDGTQMVYGSAYGFPLADDVVAHELTHGVTQYESNLFPYYQSGAIDESLSDVFGEYYDQVGNVTAGDTAGVKWLLGEDVSGLGAIRSMSNPPAFGDPDKMTSPNYYTGADDNGGVHFNSGVNNKAVYLMVEGGTFNGITVTGIGWEKTAATYYEANANLLTSASDYSDLYYAVQQACINLLGQHGITAGDCTQVLNALNAVEMKVRQALGNFEDPSFEASYTVYPYWSQSSTNFGTPLCTIADCTNGGGTAGPRTGVVWSWFGGTPNNETASVSQTIYLPGGYPGLKLKFYLWIGAADAGSNTADVFTVQVDGVTVFSANATQKSSYATYAPVSVDISAFANGDLHTILFSSVTTGQLVTFNLDDIALTGETFSDVPQTHPYYNDIEILYANGYTGGCSITPLLFCPNTVMNRAQAAVFMLRGNFGSSYVPVTPTHFFGDNWANALWAEGWAESMFLEGLSGGCSTSPLLFCPEEQLTNVQAAVFALRMKYGTFYQPPAASGTVFADLTDVSFWGTPWAEQAYANGLIPACGTSGGKPLFCPNSLVSRGFGASIIVKAKNLVMP